MDLDKIIADLKECKLPTEDQVLQICQKVRDLMFDEANVHPISSPVTVSNFDLDLRRHPRSIF